MAKRDFNQNNIGEMLCPMGATDGCPGAISAAAVEEESRDICDADENGQIDGRDLLTMLRSPGPTGGIAALVNWNSCTDKCTYRGCSIAPNNGRGCGLLGLEGVIVLLPWAARRRRLWRTGKL